MAETDGGVNFEDLLGIRIDSVTQKLEADKGDVEEARKRGSVRRDEVRQAIMKPEGEAKVACDLGRELAGGARSNEELKAMYINLADTVKDDLGRGEADERLSESVIGVLGGRVGELTHGRHEIFRDLPPDLQTAEEGRRRKAGQQVLVEEKAILLGIAAESMSRGEIGRGVAAINAAALGPYEDEQPAWLLDAAVGGVESADLEVADTRKALDSLRAAIYGHLTDVEMERELAKAQDREMTSRERILAVIVASQAKQRELDTLQAKEKEAREYRERMETGYRSLMRSAAEVGEEKLKALYEGNYGGMIPLPDRQGTSALRELYLADAEWRKICQSNDGGRLDYMRVLMRLNADSGLQKVAAAKVLERQERYGDYGYRKKEDYLKKGEEEAWDEYGERLVRLELYGQALGAVKWAMEARGTTQRPVNEQARREVCQRALAILSGGELARFLSGKDEDMAQLNSEQKLAREALFGYLAEYKKKMANAMGEEYEVQSARFGQLGKEETFLGVGRVQNEIKAEMSVRLEREEKEREEQKRRVEKERDGAREVIRELAKVNQEIVEFRARVDGIFRFAKMEGPDPVAKLFRVTGGEGMEAVKVELIESVEQRKAKVEELKKAAEADVDSPEKRKLWLDAQTELEMVSKISEYLARINGQAGRTTLEKRSGLSKKIVARIAGSAFNSIPVPSGGEYSSYYTSQAEEVARILGGGNDRELAGTERVVEQLYKILEVEGRVEGLAKGVEAIKRRIADARQKLEAGKRKLEGEKAVKAADFVRTDLYRFLERKDRLVAYK